ncbi:anti-sigma factor domain-containing protein [Ekhidna sp.]|uniref:anti-sigma factor n=1 Tax=Ekhidna sp. TaxID=2608089 RepID=UPI003514EB51
MNIEEYISSGILEAYVMDQLSPAERTEVEQAAANHLEIREELDKIERSMETLAFATAVKPPAGVKEKLMAQIEKGASDQKEAPVVQMQTDRSYGILKFAAAASVLVALASAVLAFTYWKKWQGAEVKLADMIAQNAQFAENYNQVNQQLDDIQDAVAIMNSSAYRRVTMNGTENSPGALATVYWNESTADVYLSIQNLKELSKDQQYQLWAIIDGVPVDAGVFDPNNGSLLVQMKNIGPNAAAFAVTIEPRGGSENPSLETMQVVGNVAT